MSSPSRGSVKRTAALVLVAGVILGGCSDLYYDRRETISLGANDAVAGNRAIHTLDPWPRHSQNPNVAFNGERMQSAVDRYHRNRVIEPVNIGTSATAAQGAQQAPAAASPLPATSASAAAPVR
jgi:hypothetical protein